MTQHDATRSVETGDDARIAALEVELARTRRELADTLDQLAARLDMKTRGKQKAHEVKQRTQVAARSRDVQIRGGVVAAVVVVAILMLARRRRR